MRALSVAAQLVMLLFLGVIAYNTGVGKTLPVHHPNWMSCDGLLTRNLFYSTLLGQSDDLKDVAASVKRAQSLGEVDHLVTTGSTIDARRTRWFESVSDAGKCQAQVFLNTPDKDGNNTAYMAFDISAFAEAGAGIFSIVSEGQVLQSLRLDTRGTKWFKE